MSSPVASSIFLSWCMLLKEFIINSYVTKVHFMKTVSMYFLKKQLFKSLWLLINMAAALYFFIKVLTTSKSFPILTCINANLKLWWVGCNQAMYVERSTCLEWLSPPGKSSASLGMSVSVSVSNFWRGMASHKSHVCELKNARIFYNDKLQKEDSNSNCLSVFKE